MEQWTFCRVVALMLALVVCAGTVAATDTTRVTPETASAASTLFTARADTGFGSTASVTESVLPSLMRIFITLILVVAFIYGTVFILKKLAGNRVAGSGKTIQVIEHTYLAPKKSVCLLKMADRAVLVGITDTTINTLTEMDWESLPAEIGQRLQTQPKNFPGLLGNAAAKFFGSKQKGGEYGRSA